MIKNMNKIIVIDQLNKILEFELASAVRYTNYSLMMSGYKRTPIVQWMTEQAEESLSHAKEAEGLITYLGENPSLSTGTLLEKYKQNIVDILSESLAQKREALYAYQQLLALVEDHSLLLEKFVRRMIAEVNRNQDMVEKLLRKRSEINTFSCL